MLFISHSSKDLATVDALVELIRSAVILSADEVRCTSLDGYRLPGGASIDDQLRQEVYNAEAFIGIISYDSVESMYVVFELGARWGAKKHLIPLLAPGVRSNVLQAPLSGLNALRCDNSAHLHQLIAELGKLLGRALNPAASYQRYVDKVVGLPAVTGQVTLSKYLEAQLHLDYAARMDKMDKDQQRILEWAKGESKRRKWIPQKDFEDFLRGHVYWRLEALCLLGFIEKEVAEFHGEIPRYVYTLSPGYTDWDSQRNR